ncbi:MAG: bifunctional heptose 7-phosphate kinase/heptose 1-phosphate adenyltransferase [Desulfovibrionaceae bacterium]|jgi:rfaE bifunctional protein nucleotidyltransferase chain/domain|nr:bifunctional heptose 7-phosphate kinase/heptose 1-phosphate adenyltransferase [Desulfovibrionaceae bacterium]
MSAHRPAPLSANPDHPKILAPAELARRLAAERAGKAVVFTNGCYDILHPGHVDLLARARALGDVLVLGLNTDASVRRLGKGADRPVNPLAVRAFVAAHLASVSFVTWFDEDTPLELITALQPDVLVKGGDWPVEAIVGRDVVQARGGRVLSLPLLPGFSTTSLLHHIRTAQP